MRRRPVRALTAVGMGIDAGVVLLDALTPHFDVPIAPLAIAPLLTATAGLLTATACLAVLSLALATAITAAHGMLGDTEELVRLGTVAAIEILAVLGTRLRRRLDGLAQALDALPDAVTIQDGEGRVLYGNRAAGRLALEGGKLDPGAAQAYLERMEVTDEVGGSIVPGEMPARRLVAGLEAAPVVVRTRDPASGAVTWVRVQASPLRNAEGRVRSAVNVIEDITSVKVAELRAAFLSEAGAILGSSLDTRRTLPAALRVAVPAFTDVCVVALFDRRGRPEAAASVAGKGAEGLAAAVQDPGRRAQLVAGGRAPVLEVPVALGPRRFGTLTWARTDATRAFGPEDTASATALAERVAVAVENARIHAARAGIASVLEAALLPTALPTVEGWEFAAHYRAAGEANDVGGDFYDVAPLGDAGLLALIGDVVGKGARAAALTARTRHTLVAAAALAGGDPLDGLRLLDGWLRSEDPLELCTVAVLTAHGPEVTVRSAGHPLPLLLRDGALSELGCTSPMLGAAPPGATWTARTHTLQPGDLVVLHTDGVTDAVGPDGRFEEALLHDALLDGPADAQAAVDRVVAGLDAFEQGAQADDRALLVMRWTGETDPSTPPARDGAPGRA